MNEITLIGRLAVSPTYHCTHGGRDLTRFELRTSRHVESASAGEAHHCVAWGPAALDLHENLDSGDRLLIRGELRYRSRQLRSGGVVRVPEVYVRGYTYLGN